MAHDRPPVPDVSGSAWLFLANRAWEQSERGYSKILSPTLPTCASLACTHPSCARFALERLGMLPCLQHLYCWQAPRQRYKQRRKRKEYLSYFSFCLCLIIVLRLLGVELHRDARSPPGIRLLRPSHRSLGILGYPKRCHGPPPRDPWCVQVPGVHYSRPPPWRAL